MMQLKALKKARTIQTQNSERKEIEKIDQK
jgi:hypothetical protein